MTFKPALLPNHLVGVKQAGSINYYKILDVEPFKYESGDETTALFTATASGSSDNNNDFTDLEPDDKPFYHIFQVRAGLYYDMTYTFQIPIGTQRFGTDTLPSVGTFDSTISPHFAPSQLTEMWLVNSVYPRISATNNSNLTLTPKIRFLGFKYEAERVKDPDMFDKLNRGLIPFKQITIGGLRK